MKTITGYMTLFLMIHTQIAISMETRRQTVVTLSSCQDEANPNLMKTDLYVQNLKRKITTANPDIFSEDLNAADICLGVKLTKSQRAWAEADKRSAKIDSGLIMRVKNDDQLAFTMAHELAHITMRHAPLDGIPIEGADREDARELLRRHQAKYEEILAWPKDGPREVFERLQRELREINQELNNIIVDHHGEEAVSNWMETEADVVGAYYYLRSGFDPLEVTWRLDQIVIALNDAGLDPRTQSHGPGYDPHGPPPAMTSDQRVARALAVCRLDLGPFSEPPIRGTHRYPMPCWQIWNIKFNLAQNEPLFFELYQDLPPRLDQEVNPSLTEVKDEIDSHSTTR